MVTRVNYKARCAQLEAELTAALLANSAAASPAPVQTPGTGDGSSLQAQLDDLLVAHAALVARFNKSEEDALKATRWARVFRQQRDHARDELTEAWAAVGRAALKGTAPAASAKPKYVAPALTPEQIAYRAKRDAAKALAQATGETVKF